LIDAIFGANSEAEDLPGNSLAKIPGVRHNVTSLPSEKLWKFPWLKEMAAVSVANIF